MITTDPLVIHDAASVNGAARRLINYLESGIAAEALFTADAFCDLSFPHWRIQTASAAQVLAARAHTHPYPGTVRVERLDSTDRGFVLAFEERWMDAGQHWYSRELVRADVLDGRIVDMSVYCTGDWDEARQEQHAREVTLIRP